MGTRQQAFPSIPGKHIKQFSAWLTAQGCEIQPATNEFEVIRFRCQKGTGVVYNGKKGYTISSPMVYEAYECFVYGRQWAGKGKPSKRTGGSKRTRQLIDRDGNRCFYCDKEMTVAEMTKEHLLSVNHGGADRLENMVLACQECNLKAGHLPVIDKVRLRDEMRAY